MSDTEARLRVVETAQAVHEAVCAERHKGITMRLNVVLAGIGVLLAALAGGAPLVQFFRALLIH